MGEEWSSTIALIHASKFKHKARSTFSQRRIPNTAIQPSTPSVNGYQNTEESCDPQMFPADNL